MVIKGRIHGELGKFERYLWNSVKSDDEMSLEIGDFRILRKITQNRIHGIKNQVRFGGEFEEKSKFEERRKFRFEKRFKTEN